MVKRFLKAIKFPSFIIATNNVTSDDIKTLEISDNRTEEVVSSLETFLGYDETSNSYFIYEWENYNIYALEYPLSNEDHLFHGSVDPLKSHGLLKLENFVGNISFRGIHFEVHSKKLDLKNVRKLTNEIDQKVSSLSLYFNQFGVAKRNLEKNKEKSNEFNRFIYIYNLLNTGKLQNILKFITEHPHQHIEKNIETLNFSIMQDISEDTVIDIFSGNTTFTKSSSTSTISRKLNNFVPKQANRYKSIKSYDNNENQLVLFFLRQCLKTLNSHIRILNFKNLDSQKVDENYVSYLIQLRKVISRYINHPMFREVSNLTTVNHSSTILTRRKGYKEVFSYFLKMNSVPKNSVNNEDFIKLIENKSIDKLYEYKGLFTIENILKKYYSIEPDRYSLKTSNINFSTSLDEKSGKIFFSFTKENYPETTLYFQKNFSYNVGTSYALNLKPDFTLLIKKNGKKAMYHFDTKFKVKQFNHLNKYIVTPDHLAKEEDLKTMHAYRDGIKDTIGSFVLYPAGNKLDFYEIQNEKTEKKAYRGIGSIPLLLNKDNSCLEEFIFCLLDFYR